AELLAAHHEVAAGRHHAAVPTGLPTVDLDLLSPASLVSALESARPEVVVHAAALADADRCQAEPDLARRANVDASAEVARLCHARGARLIAISTDLVASGERAWIREDDPAEPKLVYGRTKLAGEEAVLATAPGAAVVRGVGLPAGASEPATQAALPLGARRPADASPASRGARAELDWAPRALDDAIRDSRRADL